MNNSTTIYKENYKISVRLDNRRKKQSGKYPVKLRVYDKVSKKEKWFALGIDLTASQFETIWENPKNKDLRGANKELRLKLQSIEIRANEEARQMTVFEFERFETKLFRKSSDKNNIKYYFDLIIANKIKDDKIGTAESYKYTLNSLKDFSQNYNGCKIEKLTFDAINVSWLKDYEKYMLELGKSYTTIAIYTRTLRVVFNTAIDNNDISNDIYPFGKNKYKIPRTRKVNKALKNEQLKLLFDSKPANENEAKAKDFWFFSYACNGMNFKDIAQLKHENIKDDAITYYRAKTFDKSAEKVPIVVYLTTFTNGVIENYGSGAKTGYVFDIISENDNAKTQHKKIKNFVRYVNDHIKRIAKANNLPSDISTYWARHSFATNSLRKGYSMEFISEALNHSDLSVTKNYFAGFEDEAKKEFANTLMDF